MQYDMGMFNPNYGYLCTVAAPAFFYPAPKDCDIRQERKEQIDCNGCGAPMRGLVCDYCGRKLL